MLADNKIKESLNNAIVKTFEEMAFIDVMPLENSDFKYHQIAYLTFTSPIQGSIILFLPKDCKKTIVENIHGTNWEDLHTDQIDDCLLELLNVVGGNFLNNLFGDDEQYNITFPQMLFELFF